jgi:membrane-bound lytic murein transglycosylase D
MRVFKILTIGLLLSINALSAQEETIIQNNQSFEEKPKISFLDSIKATFVKHDLAACIDERWVAELSNPHLYQEMVNDIKTFDGSKYVEYGELSTDVLKERLRLLDEKSAFHIEYNQVLENTIKHYLKNRKKSFERLLGISQFYFPMYENALAAHNVPLEIKYLSIVESALNPKAVSRVGATGLWQFMFYTGKEYNLNISTYVDERSDPLLATNAACRYMQRMYNIFGDWDLVLASYNAGPGNVSKAIRRSGGKQNYWNIRPHLPKETQGYVPAFIATMYVLEYHKEHGIVPQKAVANLLETDTIHVRNKMTFKQLSEMLDIPESQIEFFNPSYKRQYIPNITGEKHFVRLPLNKVALFASNEEKLYAYANYDFSKREKAFEKSTAIAKNDKKDDDAPVDENGYKWISTTKLHKVKRGETLSSIAKKYDISIDEIKDWNNLRKNTAQLHANYKIIKKEKIKVAIPKTIIEEPVKTEADIAIAATVIDEKPIVKSMANISTDTIKFRSPKKLYHVVEKDDNLFRLAMKYDITANELKERNQLTSDVLPLGKNLFIKELGETQSTNAEIIEKAIVKVENKKSETKKVNKPTIYIVRKGDTLGSISNEFKGISVAEIKKMNNLKDNNIRPGMKLKVISK